MPSLVRYVVAAVLMAHGVGHIIFFMASWGQWAGSSGRIWVLPAQLGAAEVVTRAFGSLWLVPLVGFVVAALGLVFHQPWWAPLAVAAAAVSLLMVVLQWTGLPTSNALWALVVDAAVVVAVLWLERSVPAIGR